VRKKCERVAATPAVMEEAVKDMPAEEKEVRWCSYGH